MKIDHQPLEYNMTKSENNYKEKNLVPQPYNRKFDGIWIPAEIWLCKGLTYGEKMLWAEINSLYSAEKKGCHASNQYLAEFMGVTERMVQVMLSKLRKLGLVYDVAFDGRKRIICADKKFHNLEWCESEGKYIAGETRNTFYPCHEILRNKSLYRDTSIDTSLDIPPFPPSQKEEPDGSKPAEAGEQEREKKPTKITPEIKELAKSMNASLEEANPDYRTPSNQTAFLKEVELMVRLDQREPEKVLEVLDWALEDTTQRGDFNGWSSVMYSKNPAASLRKHFAKIAQQMTSKPKKQERKFLPCSDDEEAVRIAKELFARGI